jgi:hypothetical protein
MKTRAWLDRFLDLWTGLMERPRALVSQNARAVAE